MIYLKGKQTNGNFLIVFFIIAVQISFSFAQETAEFSLRHDETKYGKYLNSFRVPDSLPTYALSVQGKFLYSSGSGHFTVYDISQPNKPKMLSRILGLGDGRQMDVYKNVAYVTARTGGLYIIDVHDPARPFLRSHYDTIELATGVKCDNDIAYVCQRQFGTEFIDISDPSLPKHLGYVLSDEAQSVDIANGILYAGDWGSRKLTIFDVRNLKNPQLLGTAPLGGLGDGLFIRDNLCFAATGLVNSKFSGKKKPVGGNGLNIISVKDPKNPKVLSRLDMPRLFFKIYPDTWSVETDDHHTAYLNSTYNGLFCIDVSDPVKPVFKAHAVPKDEAKNRPDCVCDLAMIKDMIYAAGCNSGLFVVPAPGIARPIGPRSGLPVLKDPVPNDPSSVNEITKRFNIYRPGGQVCAVAQRDSKSVWVAAGSAGIHLLDISAVPPRPIAVIPTRGFAYDVKFANNLLFTAENDNGFAIYQTMPNGSARQIGAYNPGSMVRQAVVPDPNRYALIKHGNANVEILDISNPRAPKSVLTDSVRRLGILYGPELVDGMSKNRTAACFWWGGCIAWFDLSGSKPIELPETEIVKGSFFEGTVIYKDKFWHFKSGGYYVYDIADKRPEKDHSFYKIPELKRSGKSFIGSNGIAVICDRRNGIINRIDVSKAEQPKFLDKIELKGHPEPGLFINGKMIIPCGYTGLLIEK